MVIKHGRHITYSITVSSGVPQGSHLGPSCSMGSSTTPVLYKFKCLLFPDNLKLFTVMDSQDDHKHITTSDDTTHNAY